MSRALDEAVMSLWTGLDGKQFERLRKYGISCLRRQGVPRNDQEDLAIKVIARFSERARAGFDSPDYPSSYFYRSLCNAAKSHFRRTNKGHARHEDGVEIDNTIAAHGRETGNEAWLEADVPTMVRQFVDEYVDLTNRASEAMPTARAKQFRASCAEMLDLKLGQRDFERVLRMNGVTPGLDDKQRKRIVDKIQQRHKRAREALAKYVDHLKASQELDKDQAKAWHERIIRLRRRQNGGVASVLRGEPVAPHLLALGANEDDNE